MNKKFFMMMGNSGPVIPPLTLTTLTATDTRYIYKSNATFSTARTGSGGFIDSSPTSSLHCYYNTTYKIARIFSLFNLSTVPGTIYSAKLVVYSHTSFNTINGTIETCPNTGALTTADFSNKGGLYGTGSERIITTLKIPFNEAGITLLNNKGTQRFVTCEYEHDYLNIAPDPSSLVNQSAAAASTIEIYYY